MTIEKCRWKYGKQAPVMFMIDDFANKYMTDRENGNYLGSDWGGRCKAQNSLYEFLQQKIFQDFPYVKLTLFLVVGRREKFMEGGKPSFSEAIDYNKEFAAFLTELANDGRFEVAYHGYTHGKQLGEKYLTQEWLTFASLEEACQTIDKCKDTYREVTGKAFYGGKYCGYEYNDFSDTSIAKTGFEWWCRHWDAALFTGRGNGDESLDLEEFQGVVDIPSTVDGSLTSLWNWQAFPGRAYQKALYYRLKYGVTMEQVLDSLVKNGQVINIQEHSSPMREDEKHQRPNLVDDIGNIQYMLRYLKKYDLWYATGHEIAEYWQICQHTSVFLDGEQVVVSTDSPEYFGKAVWFTLSNGEGTLDESCSLKTDTGKIITGIKKRAQMLFKVKCTRQREVYSIIRR